MLLVSGMLSAIDINEGRLRILAETAKLQQVDNVITTIHADLCVFAVSIICVCLWGVLCVHACVLG